MFVGSNVMHVSGSVRSVTFCSLNVMKASSSGRRWRGLSGSKGSGEYRCFFSTTTTLVPFPRTSIKPRQGTCSRTRFKESLLIKNSLEQIVFIKDDRWDFSYTHSHTRLTANGRVPSNVHCQATPLIISPPTKNRQRNGCGIPDRSLADFCCSFRLCRTNFSLFRP